MKKRSILLSVLLAFAMLLCACGSNQEQSLDGKWVGTLDVTKHFEDGVKKANPDLAKYIDFENLVFTVDIEFVEGEMSFVARQESIDTFEENFAAGMQKIAKGYWTANLATYDMTLEEEIFESGMTEEDYMAEVYKATGIDKMVEGMTTVTKATLDKFSEMKGMYTVLGNELRLWYEEESYEAMQYGFKGKKLNITIDGGDFSLLIECEKSK